MRPSSLALLAAAGLGLATGAASAQAAADEPLRVRLNADIRSTDPGVNRDGNTDMVMFHLVEGLVAHGEDLAIVPMLAESVELSEEGLTYTFTLREGVPFHNGAVLEAEDVLFAWNRYMDPDTGWRCLSDFDGRGVANIAGIEAPDARTVVFALEEPAALFLTSMARVDCGQAGIFHRDSLNEDGSWNTPIGTGPYTLGEWRPDQFIDLHRFADYAALPGDLDGLAGNKSGGPESIRLMLIPDTAASTAALQSHSIDMVPGVDESVAESLGARPEFTLASTATLGVSGILLQTRDPLLSDPRIRRAFAMALDTEGMVEVLAGGAVGYNASPIPDVSGYHGPVQAQGYSHDPAGARALLAEAGYNGAPLVILTNSRYRSMNEMAVLAQAMLEEAGFNASFEVMDWATQLDRYSSGDYAAMAFSFSARYDAGLSFDMFSGSKDETPRWVWDNAEAREILAQALSTLNPAERQPLFDRLHTMMIEDVPAIWLYNPAALSLTGPRVASFTPWASVAPRLWAVRMN